MLQHSPSKRFFKNLCVCKSFTISLAPLNGICRRKKENQIKMEFNGYFKNVLPLCGSCSANRLACRLLSSHKRGKKEPSSPQSSYAFSTTTNKQLNKSISISDLFRSLVEQFNLGDFSLLLFSKRKICLALAKTAIFTTKGKALNISEQCKTETEREREKKEGA